MIRNSSSIPECESARKDELCRTFITPRVIDASHEAKDEAGGGSAEQGHHHVWWVVVIFCRYTRIALGMLAGSFVMNFYIASLLSCTWQGRRL